MRRTTISTSPTAVTTAAPTGTGRVRATARLGVVASALALAALTTACGGSGGSDTSSDPAAREPKPGAAAAQDPRPAGAPSPCDLLDASDVSAAVGGHFTSGEETYHESDASTQCLWTDPDVMNRAVSLSVVTQDAWDEQFPDRDEYDIDDVYAAMKEYYGRDAREVDLGDKAFAIDNQVSVVKDDARYDLLEMTSEDQQAGSDALVELAGTALAGT